MAQVPGKREAFVESIAYPDLLILLCQGLDLRRTRNPDSALTLNPKPVLLN